MQKKYSSYEKTLFFVACSAIASGYSAYVAQSAANKKVTACSCLDPIIVGVIAIGSASFLIRESMVAINRNKESRLRQQISRCVRLCIGMSILVISIIQFIYA